MYQIQVQSTALNYENYFDRNVILRSDLNNYCNNIVIVDNNSKPLLL